jgi:TolB protein
MKVIAQSYTLAVMGANRVRLAVVLLAVVFIVIVATSGSGGDKKKDSSQQATKPVALSPYSNIYVVDVETRELRALTHNQISQLAQGPSWSAQGTIAFTQASCDECISKLTLTRSGSARATIVKHQPRHVFQPTWSPDGHRVALVRLGFGLYTVDVRGGRQFRLSKNEADEAPAWSPRGKPILFDRQVSGSNWDLFAIDPDGRNQRRLTHGPLQETNPTWSPRGSMIAFARQGRNGNWAILTMKADGSGRRPLTDPSVSSQEPSWSPDGSKIAYVEQVGARAYLSVISIKSGKSRRLTGDSFVASRPVWSPDGKKIAFSAKGASTDPSKFPEVGHEGEPEP